MVACFLIFFFFFLLTQPDTEERGAHSLLAQMQQIFSHLQESEMRFFDTRPFCESYRTGPENVPMQPDQQQDGMSSLCVSFACVICVFVA